MLHSIKTLTTWYANIFGTPRNFYHTWVTDLPDTYRIMSMSFMLLNEQNLFRKISKFLTKLSQTAALFILLAYSTTLTGLRRFLPMLLLHFLAGYKKCVQSLLFHDNSDINLPWEKNPSWVTTSVVPDPCYKYVALFYEMSVDGETFPPFVSMRINNGSPQTRNIFSTCSICLMNVLDRWKK